MKIKKATRLNKDVLPLRYTLHLHTDFETSVFTGQETIEIDLKKEQSKIVMHSVGLDISSAVARQSINKQIAEIVFDQENETVNFVFKNKIKKGKIYLDIDFKGKLSDSLAGFYRSTYQDGGVTKIIATTQFEATDARRAFPCFDEPNKKAIFDMSLSIPKGKTAISNTLITKKVTYSKTHNTVHFSPTPIMSTYLLAFIIGDFEYLEKKTKRGIKIRVYTTAGKKHQAVFALECAVRSIDFYEKYFGIDYPLDTLDMIAVPDFAAGAMENWGAVTYRETALLFDEKNSSLPVKQYVAIVVAHELAHQWFGNLVTMDWWTDLWLNEGFASYMEYLCVDSLFPEWQMWDQFVANDLGGALALDALSHTHPVEVEVHHPDDISEVFDAISYEKGASIIRMLAEHVGGENFQKSVQHYLKKHAYKNTNTVDLWRSFEIITKKPISKMMGIWTKTSGHPVLNIKNESKNEIKISQKKFFISPIEKNKNKNDNTLWPIPFSYNDSNGTQKLILTKRETLLKTQGFIKANLGEPGVYRSVYDAVLIKNIENEIKTGKMSAADRLGVIRDVHAGVLNCDVKIKSALELLEVYKNEKEYIVWSEIVGLLTHIRFVYQGAEWSNNFDKYIVEFMAPVYKFIGWTSTANEPHTAALLRSLVLGTLVSTNHKTIIQKALSLYKKKHIEPDLRNAVYSAVVKSKDKKLYDNLCKRYSKAHMHEEKNRLARGRIGVIGKVEFKKTLKWILTDEVRNQDAPMYLAQALYNRFNKGAALEFVLKNWDYLLEKHSGDKYTRSRIIGAMDGFSTKKDLETIINFFKKNPHVGAERTLRQTLEQIEANIYFKKYHEKDLDKIFKK